METHTVVNGTVGNDSPMFSAFKAENQVSFIRPYTPNAIEVNGYRNAVIRYWTPKGEKEKGVAAKPAKLVTVPVITLPDSDFLLPEKARTVLIGVLEDQQDTLIKQLIDTGASVIDWETISINSCFDALTEIRISKRLNKDMVENWVKIVLANAFELRARELCNNPINLPKQIADTTADYVKLFCNLSAPVPNIDMTECNACVAMLDRAGVVDDMSTVLRQKLHDRLNPKVLEKKKNL